MLEIWTLNNVYHSYDLDQWVLAYEDNGAFGVGVAVALAHREGRREGRRVDIFPWTSIVKLSYPDVDELRSKVE